MGEQVMGNERHFSNMGAPLERLGNAGSRIAGRIVWEGKSSRPLDSRPAWIDFGRFTFTRLVRDRCMRRAVNGKGGLGVVGKGWRWG